MTTEYISSNDINDIYTAGFVTGLITEKQAVDISSMEKDAFWPQLLKAVSGGAKALGGLATGAFDVATKIPGTVGTTMLLGAGSGALGSLAYDAVKENLTREDPKEKLNRELEMMYAAKEMELEDAKWISDVTARKNKLKRDAKKMDPADYKREYNALVKLIEDKRG